MSRGSTHSRMILRNQGAPVTKSEKLRMALLGLTKIALDPTHAKENAIRVLAILGIKPKEAKNDKHTA